MKPKLLNTQRLIAELALAPTKNYVLAYSGGLDSQVLLHILASIPHINTRAVHINHGLSANADKWQAHCEQSCAALNIPLKTCNITVKPEQGESLEAYARDKRYQVLKDIINPDQVLLTAHHQSDQVETLFLQLLRGAGVKGLASMPKLKKFGVSKLLRPLLGFSRKQLEAYAKQNALTWIEDESNFDTVHDRNFVRHELMPVIKQRWPQAEKLLARVTQNCSESLSVLEDQASADLKTATGRQENTLSAKALLQLSQQRRFNVIRYWLGKQDFKMLSQQHLLQMDKDILRARIDACPLLELENIEIRRFKGDVYALTSKDEIKTEIIINWDLNKTLTLPYHLGTLTLKETQEAGIVFPENAKVSVRFRQGGEVIKLNNRQGQT